MAGKAKERAAEIRALHDRAGAIRSGYRQDSPEAQRLDDQANELAQDFMTENGSSYHFH